MSTGNVEKWGTEDFRPLQDMVRDDRGPDPVVLESFLNECEGPEGSVYALFALSPERMLRYVCSSGGAFDYRMLPNAIGCPPGETVADSCVRVPSDPGDLSRWLPGLPSGGSAAWQPLKTAPDLPRPDGMLLLWAPTSSTGSPTSSSESPPSSTESPACPADSSSLVKPLSAAADRLAPLFRLWQTARCRQKQLRRLEALEELSLTIASSLDLREVLLQTRDALVGLGFSRAGIYVLDTDAQILRGAWGTGKENEREDISSEQIPLDDPDNPFARVVRGELEYFVTAGPSPPCTSSPPCAGSLRTRSIQSAGWDAIVPLRSRGHVMGAIGVSGGSPESPMREEHLKILFPFAAHAGAAVHNACMHERLAEHLRQAEEDERQRKGFEREVILSVTDGKLHLCESPEIESRLGRPLVTTLLRSPVEVGQCRKVAMERAMEVGIHPQRRSDLELCLGEAATNCFQHAGGGVARLYKNGACIQLRVSDQGPGIHSFLLPRVTLLKGYSTTTSLGMGFSLILQLCDRLFLATSEQGTDILIEIGMEPTSETDRIWEQLGL